VAGSERITREQDLRISAIVKREQSRLRNFIRRRGRSRSWPLIENSSETHPASMAAHPSAEQNTVRL
jgi:hypothetical protein